MDTEAVAQSGLVQERWHALDPAGVAVKLDVDVGSGLSAGEAAARLNKNGPNALPVEKPPSTMRRFLAE